MKKRLVGFKYEVGNFWVAETSHNECSFSVFMAGPTHSIGIGEAYPTLDLAIARADYIAKHWDVQKHWNRLVRQQQAEMQTVTIAG